MKLSGAKRGIREFPNTPRTQKKELYQMKVEARQVKKHGHNPKKPTNSEEKRGGHR